MVLVHSYVALLEGISTVHCRFAGSLARVVNQSRWLTEKCFQSLAGANHVGNGEMIHDTYSHLQIDGKVSHHQISRDLLFHLFGDGYIDIY